MLPITIRPGRNSEVETLAACLTDAFINDAFIDALFGQAADREQRTKELYAARLQEQHLLDGVVDVAWVDDECAGVAIWAPPGVSAVGTLHQQARLASTYFRLLGWRFPRVAWGEIEADRAHPPFPHWYLHLIGVSASYRGKGVGGALLAHRISRFGTHDGAYLEATTKESARLYARHGFVAMGRQPLGPGTWELAMWRPADQGIEVAFD